MTDKQIEEGIADALCVVNRHGFHLP
jgi:hypothetical protein